MFEELKQQLSFENLQKIKLNQHLIQRNNDEESSFSKQDSIYSHEDELSERVEMFKTLMEERTHSRSLRIASDNLAEEKNRKMRKQVALLMQKMEIDKQNQQRQIKFLKQKHSRELQVIKAEVEKYQFKIKKYINEQGMILSLKKENRRLAQLVSDHSETIQKISVEKAILKKQLIALKTTLRDKQQQQTVHKILEHKQSEIEITLKREVLLLQDQKHFISQKLKSIEENRLKLRQENQELTRQVDRLKLNYQLQKQELIQKYKLEQTRIEEENLDLKRRNVKLQESFIEHLTQTSLNLQVNLKSIPERSKNTTLYLQETPIKSRSGKKEQRSPEEEDPEKSQVLVKNCNCGQQVVRLKEKLRLANSKIMNLLHEKCWRSK